MNASAVADWTKSIFMGLMYSRGKYSALRSLFIHDAHEYAGPHGRYLEIFRLLKTIPAVAAELENDLKKVDGYDLAQLAALYGKSELLEELVEAHNYPIEKRHQSGDSLLMMAINTNHISSNPLTCVYYLIQKGADVNYVNGHSFALYKAVDCQYHKASLTLQ